MKLKELKSYIRETIKKTLLENQPSTSPSKPDKSPSIAPGKPDTDRSKPRRPLGNPNVKPKPKAMNEEEILNKIVNRFKSKKTTINERSNEWELGYETGYNEGYKDAKNNKSNKFQ